MAMVDISSYLVSALDEDYDTRNLAMAELKRLQMRNSSTFMLSLAMELSNTEGLATTRQLSGILLKNCLSAREECKDEDLAEIKEMAVRTLYSSTREVWHTAAQVIAKIVGIESNEKWLKLFKQLQGNLIQPNSSPSLKQATLETLCYVCEEISPDELEATESGDILRAITGCMKSVTQNTPEIRLAAIKAFNNALSFVKFKFEDMHLWRNSIINLLCESAASGELEIRVKAFESLVAIASYSELQRLYVLDRLVEPTYHAFEEGQEPVALLAMEFWISIYEEEVCEPKLNLHDRFMLITLAPNFASKLLSTLLRHVGDWDDDSWTIPKAAQEFLSLLVSITFVELTDEHTGEHTGASDVLDLIASFVEKHSSWNSTDSDWMAAVLAIGAVIDSFQPFNDFKHSYLLVSGLLICLIAMDNYTEDEGIKKVTTEYLNRIPKVEDDEEPPLN